MPVPAITRNVMSMGQDFAPLVCGVALVVTLIEEGRALRQLLSRGRPRANPFSDAVDQIIWFVPGWGRMVRDRGLADVCSVMAAGIEAGRPVEQAIGQAAQPHLNAALRSRVNAWGEFAAAGVPVGEAANRVGLPGIVGGLLGSAVRAGNLGDALRFLSRHYESSFSRAAVLIRAAAVPGVVLVLGGAVLCVALALFEPMIVLIRTAAVYTRYW
jgi:type II secretory pathway component PulF